jgi:hypothetical protein
VSLHRARATTTVVLFQGDDLDPIEEHRAAVERAAIASAAPLRVGDEGIPASVLEAAADYDAFIEGAVERAIHLRLVAVPRRRYRELLAAHPARDGNEADEAAGFDVDGLTDELVPECVAPGQFDTDEERDEFLDDLSDAEWSRVASAAVKLNEGGAPDPKARMTSHLTPASGETSESPARLG